MGYIDRKQNYDKIRARAYDPFLNEAMHCFFVDIVIVLVGIAILFIADAHIIVPEIFLLFPFYFLIECFWNYKRAILIRIEKNYSEVTDYFQIISIRRKIVFTSGKYGSVVGSFYDPKLKIDSFRVICKDCNRRKVVLYSVMSNKKYLMLLDLMEQGQQITIEYGKLSHVIIRYVGKNDMIKRLNITL